MSIFAGKTLMITGGTGSFGNAVLILPALMDIMRRVLTSN